ncbi:uncharacterized protein V6R79_004861 [Siganus canaliculatus]
MSFHPLLSPLLVALCCLVVVKAVPSPPNINGTTTAPQPQPAVTNSSGVIPTHSATVSPHSVMGSTHSGVTTAHSGVNNSTAGGKKLPGSMFNGLDGSVIQRALYVLIGITLIGVLYFLIRAVRLKRPAHRKKYGLLSDYDDSVEMDGMDSEEDDTLYEARSLRR